MERAILASFRTPQLAGPLQRRLADTRPGGDTSLSEHAKNLL